MDVFEKAKELGSLIAVSEEMSSYKESEAQIEEDEKAKTLLSDYKSLQIELVRATKEKKDKSELEAIKGRLMTKQQELNDYGTTRNYLEAKTAYDKYIKTINNVIMFAITGEEPCSPNKCGSCSGGCK